MKNHVRQVKKENVFTLCIFSFTLLWDKNCQRLTALVLFFFKSDIPGNIIYHVKIVIEGV